MRIPNTPFSTRLSGSAKETELRLRNILQKNKKRPPLIALVAAVLIVVFCGSLVGFAPQDGEIGMPVPGENGVLAVAEVPGGVVYTTGRLGSADLYWLPSGSNIKNAKLVRENIPNVDLSTLTLTCEGNVLRLEYLQVDALVDLDLNWDGMLKTIRYRVTGEEPPFGYSQYTTLIDLDLGRNNLWITTRYRVAENTPPEYIDSGGTVAK